VLSAAGTSAAQVGNAALNGAGVVYDGLHTLGEGAILAGLVLGAIVAFIIDKRFVNAAVFAAVGSALSFIGLIHGEKVQWNANWEVSLGYLFVAVVCGLFALTKPEPRVPEPGEPAAMEGAEVHEEPATAPDTEEEPAVHSGR
jgi:AGZA family xanthine/uracil permease-like MFS transporter